MNANLLAQRVSHSIRKSSELPQKTCDEIAFHMTDWIYNLETLHNAFLNIENQTDEQVYGAILKFLIHSTEHIACASELMTGDKIENIFTISE